MDSIDVVAVAASLATVLLGWFLYHIVALERLDVRANLFGELSSCVVWRKGSELRWHLANSGPAPVLLKQIKVYDSAGVELQWDVVFGFDKPEIHLACEPLEGWIRPGEHHPLVWITKKNHEELGCGSDQEFPQSWSLVTEAFKKIHHMEVYYNDLYGHLRGGKPMCVLKEEAKGHLW